VGEDTEASELQLEERVLSHVEIGRDDVLRPIDEAVQHVASTRGEHEQRVVRAELEQLLVDARVFPRDVVCQGEGRWWGAARRGRRGAGSCAQMMQLFSMYSMRRSCSA
tara:strand:- start:300 stop:626 length:327 start_codon:yes stop_codon:yes gene_type:complete